MKEKIYILFLIVVFVVSCKSNSSAMVVMHNDTVQNYSSINNFQILKIKKMENKVYVIYAQKGDSIYKVVSEKEKYTQISCNPIKENSTVFLDLVQIFPQKSLFGLELSGSYYSTVRGMNINDVIVEVEESSNNSLYRADNLNGLCLIKVR